MPRSTSGKWVARAGSTGGGRTYRGQIPINWYLVLLLIVVVGIGSVVYARGEYRSAAAADTVEPTTTTTWYVGYVLDICGTLREPVTANETDPTKQSFYTVGDGVIVVSPKKTTVAGTHAVLGKFANGYPGMKLSATAVTVPPSASKKATAPTSSAVTTTAATTTTTGAATATTTTTGAATGTTTTTAATSADTTAHSDIQLDAKTKKKDSTTTTTGTTATTAAGATTSTAAGATTTTEPPATTTTTEPSKTYTNGETCAKGTKDAGKKADVMVTYWANAFDSKGKPSTVSGNPSTLLFSSDQEITIGFVPAGTTLPKPTGTVVEALLKAATNAEASTTTTTTAASTSTTTPVSTTTSGSTTTTTAAAAATTSTTAAPTTTTTAAAATTTTTAATTTTTGKKKT